MAQLTPYHEAFWGEDFTSSTGFDVLCRHNTDQKRFLKDFEDYLRSRSKLEHEYSKGLMQLSKSMKERTALGELDNAWNSMTREVDSSLQAHEAASGFLNQHAEHVKRLCRELTARRDTIEDRVKGFHNQKVSQFKTVQSLLKTYGQKCRENDQLTAAYQVMDRGVTRTPRDLDKAKSKMDKSEDEANKADVAYKNGVQSLEERRQDWEREMEQACKEFQERDDEQMQFLRSQMWSTMNILSQVALDVDEGCEAVRAVLETCDVDEDLQRFVTTHSTGTQRPAPVLYQNYYDNNPSGNGKNHRPPAAMQRSPSLSSSSSSTSTPRPSRFTAQGRASSDMAAENDVDDPTYSTADPVYSLAS